MIRPAQASDAPQIAAIWNDVISTTAATFNSIEKSPADVAEMISARANCGHGFMVAQAARDVCGFACYDQFRGGIGYRHSMEHTIHLSANARGKGLGRALMTAIEDHARAGGVHVMVAGITAENPDGRAFHQALGYTLVGTLPQVGHKFGRFMDLWLLQKILT